MSVDDAFDQVSAGQEIRFLPGNYQGCWELYEDQSGTYNAPVVIKADPPVNIDCCNSGRNTCFNLEFADYVAIDGFTLRGGDYGVRAVGGYATSEHQKGIAILNNEVSNQYRDPIFSGGSDWSVVENNTATGAGDGDGHGIYLSGESNRHVLQFIVDSTNNTVRNNVLLGVSRSTAPATANSNVPLVEQDASTGGNNNFAGNYFIGGYFDGFTPDPTDQTISYFHPFWFADFPLAGVISNPESFKPIPAAPFVYAGTRLSTAPKDRVGTVRPYTVDLGPWQVTPLTPCLVLAETVTTILPPIVCDAISVSSGFTIAHLGEATLNSRLYINFNKEFKVEHGGVLHAKGGYQDP